MKIKDEVWILSDDRPGGASQAIGLAEELGFEYKIINLKYSFLASLPNFLFSHSLFRLTRQSRGLLKKQNYLPKFIISAGRRLAPIALHLKNKSQNQARVVQIMNPNLPFEKFDFVILPKHDSFKESDFSNLITTVGALTKINEQAIRLECEKFSSWFLGDSKKIRIALLVGGSSKGGKFEEISAIKLAKISSKIAKNMQAELLILTSRRTSDELSQAIESNLECDYRFFAWKNLGGENPYLAIIGYADFFIITGDSVSMISECCSSGKPVYIFDDAKISTVKHQKFHQNLLGKNCARRLSRNLEVLENFKPKKLEETKRVADLIWEKEKKK